MVSDMMTAEQLKASILQLAMQGKLVEQRTEEGTGEELYKEILVKKKKLDKQGKIKSGKILNESVDDYPFDIPETWKWTRLGEIINYRMGKTPPRADALYWGKDVPWVSIADMIDGKTILDTKEGVSVKAIEECFHGQISCKDTLIMSFKLTVGRVSILGMDAVHNEAIISIFPVVDDAYVMRNYLKTMLPFLAVFGESKKAIKGFTLNSKSLNNIPVPLPPLAEQKRIVAKIEELMPFVEQYAVTSTKLNTLNASFPEMMKKSILQEAVQGKLVPQDPNDEPASVLLEKIAAEKKRLIKEGKIKKQKPLPEIMGEEIPFDIPESWEWVRFNDICAVLTCGYASTPTYVSKEDGMPFISAKNIKPYKFMPDEHNYISHNLYKKLVQNAKPEKGDILLTRVGAGIGEAAIIDIDLDFAIYVSLTLIKLVSNHLIDNRYILYWLNSPIGVSSAKKNIFGKNASQGNLNVKNVRDFLVPLPPIAEQERIVEKIEVLLPFTKCSYM